MCNLKGNFLSTIEGKEEKEEEEEGLEDSIMLCRYVCDVVVMRIMIQKTRLILRRFSI